MDLSLLLMVSAGRTDHFEKQQSQQAASSTWCEGIVGQDGVSGGLTKRRTKNTPQPAVNLVTGRCLPPLLGRQKHPHTASLGRRQPCSGWAVTAGGPWRCARDGRPGCGTLAAPVSGLTARGPLPEARWWGVEPEQALWPPIFCLPPSLPLQVLTTPDEEGQEGASARGSSPGLQPPIFSQTKAGQVRGRGEGSPAAPGGGRAAPPPSCRGRQ